MSAPLANYVDLVRHSAVRLAVADAPEDRVASDGGACHRRRALVEGGGRAAAARETRSARRRRSCRARALSATAGRGGELLRIDADGGTIVAHDATGDARPRCSRDCWT